MHYIDILRAGGIVVLSMLIVVSSAEENQITTINETNWRDLLTGEWLVKFYAPWCPACKAMSPAWMNLAKWCRDDNDENLHNIRIADVDVTVNPGLTGRFMVTSLPTIFHTKDGTCRVYAGSRDDTELYNFLNEDKYMQLEPLPWYWAPNSILMECLSLFFKMAVVIRDIHSGITTTYGLPVWASYLLFAVSTIVAGFVLALLLILLCDKVLASRAPHLAPRDTYPHPNITADDGPDDVSDVVEDDLPVTTADRTDYMSGGDFARPTSTRRRH